MAVQKTFDQRYADAKRELDKASEAYRKASNPTIKATTYKAVIKTKAAFDVLELKKLEKEAKKGGLEGASLDHAKYLLVGQILKYAAQEGNGVRDLVSKIISKPVNPVTATDKAREAANKKNEILKKFKALLEADWKTADEANAAKKVAEEAAGKQKP